MAVSNTYQAIATTTLGSAVSSYTFSSISGSYTDLVLVVASNSNVLNINLRFNSDSTALYSDTALWGTGTSATSGRDTGSTFIYGTYSSGQVIQKWQIMNYSNTTTNKTVLLRVDDSAVAVGAVVGLYRSTNAISSINILAGTGNLPAGLTATIYGIAAA
jgi:hypothetical protein